MEPGTDPGTQITHPRLGRGTIVFDKPNCVQVDFTLYGKWNFSQEEWASGKVAPERLRGIHSLAGSAQSDLEYELEVAVENGDISEQEALRLLEKNVHPLEVKKLRTPDLNSAYAEFKAHPDDKDYEDVFYHKLLQYITIIIKKHSHDGTTFSNIEDAISIAAIRVWKSLKRFDSLRSSFARFVTVITNGEISSLYRAYKCQESPLEELAFKTSTDFSSDKKVLFSEWLDSLERDDRTIVQMLIDGLTVREIAEATDQSRSTISDKIQRLRRTKPPF